MRALREVFAGVAGAAALTASTAAWAAQPGPDALPIAVIAVQSDAVDDQAEALTTALRDAVRAAPGWSLGDRDDPFDSPSCATITHARLWRWSSPPPTADRPKAEALVAAGNERYKLNDFAGALAAYQSADDLMRVPTTGIIVAETLFALGRFAEAAEVALKVSTDPRRPDEPTGFADAREDARKLVVKATKQASALKITLSDLPPSANVSFLVDGIAAPVSADGVTILVNPGAHQVTACAPRYRGTADLAVREGERVTVPLPLRPTSAAFAALAQRLHCAQPLDDGCKVEIADKLAVDRYMWASIRRENATIKGEVSLWTRGSGTVRAPVAFAVKETSPNSDALRTLAKDLLTTLTGGPPTGSLRIKAGATGGDCFVDGKRIGALTKGEGTFRVPSGKHTISVKAPGYADTEAQVILKPTGPTAEVTLTLLPVRTSPVNVKRISGVGLMGVGVAFGVVGLTQSIKVNELEQAVNGPNGEMYRYRQERSTVNNVCDQARLDSANSTLDAALRTRARHVEGYCSDAATPTLLQTVFYPLAAVAVGAGAFLVATSGTKKATTGMTWHPQVGPNGAKLDVAYAW